ncbi:hypothetical protein A2U01_0082017, partial [Trifolium medium]|nr:hypothetical protein [Trifolium medium]
RFIGTHGNNQVDIAPGFGRRAVEALEVGAHVRGQVALVELYGLESVGIHNVNRAARIDEDSADLARKQLKACLRENADLFACSAAEMH